MRLYGPSGFDMESSQKISRRSPDRAGARAGNPEEAEDDVESDSEIVSSKKLQKRRQDIAMQNTDNRG
jgi:hypothetical protein